MNKTRVTAEELLDATRSAALLDVPPRVREAALEALQEFAAYVGDSRRATEKDYEIPVDLEGWRYAGEVDAMKIPRALTIRFSTEINDRDHGAYTHDAQFITVYDATNVAQATETLEHELVHFIQEALALGKGFRDDSLGVPNGRIDYEERERETLTTSHPLQQVEFQPLLQDEVRRFQQQPMDVKKFIADSPFFRALQRRPDDWQRASREFYKAVTTKTASDDPPVKTLEWRGLPISIEVEGGDVRFPGDRYETLIPESWLGYGYFDDLPGDDGDSLDVIAGPEDLDETPVFLAVQTDPGGERKFVQWKVMLGFADAVAAEAGYRLLWPAKMFGGITEVDAEEFVDLVLPKIVAEDVIESEDADDEESNHKNSTSAAPAPSGSSKKAKNIVGDTCPHCQQVIFERDIFGRGDRWFHRPCVNRGPIDKKATQTFNVRIPISNLWLLSRWGHPISPDRLQYQLEHGDSSPPIKVFLAPSYMTQNPDYTHSSDPQVDDPDAVTPAPKLDPAHPAYAVSDGHHRTRARQQRGETHIDAVIEVPEVPYYLQGQARAAFEAEIQQGIEKLHALSRKSAGWTEDMAEAGRRNYEALQRFVQHLDATDSDWRDRVAEDIKRVWMEVDGISRDEAEARYTRTFSDRSAALSRLDGLMKQPVRELRAREDRTIIAAAAREAGGEYTRLAQLIERQPPAPGFVKRAPPHAHEYPWGNFELDADPQHPHTSVPEPPAKPKSVEPNYFDQNVERGEGAGSYYQQIAPAYGKLAPGQPVSLQHYDYRPYEQKIDDLIQSSGYQVYYAGGKYGKPDLAARNYNTGHLMVYDPTSNSADEEAVIRPWRKIHELAHAQAYKDLNAKYGEGRRIGKLGYHRTLREAKRAVEWEALAVAKQRQLSEQVGYPIDDVTFAREWNTVLHDAVHRAVTGKFTNPDEEGFQPSDTPVPLEVAFKQLEDYARQLGLPDEDSLLTPEQRGRTAMPKRKHPVRMPAGYEDVTLDAEKNADGSVTVWYFGVRQPGQGRGRAAWEAFEQSLPAGTTIQLSSYDASVGFWESMGFTPEDHQFDDADSDYYTDTEPVLNMSKTRTAAMRLPRAAYEILDRVAPGSSFGSGGCWLLADALRQARGGDVVAIVDAEGTAHHFLWRNGAQLVDVDGTWSEVQAMRNMARLGVQGPRIVPWAGGDAGEIPVDQQAATELAQVLRGRAAKKDEEEKPRSKALEDAIGKARGLAAKAEASGEKADFKAAMAAFDAAARAAHREGHDKLGDELKGEARDQWVLQKNAFTGEQGRQWERGEHALHSSGEQVSIVEKFERDGGISAYLVRFITGPRRGEQVAATPDALKPADGRWDTAKHAKVRVTAGEVLAAGAIDVNALEQQPTTVTAAELVDPTQVSGEDVLEHEAGLRKRLPPKARLWTDLLAASGVDYPSDFVTADAAYRQWRALPREMRVQTPKPEWRGGETDALNHALDRMDSSRVSGPYEAFELLTRNIVDWDSLAASNVLQVLRTVPGLEQLRLPDAAYERALKTVYGPESEYVQRYQDENPNEKPLNRRELNRLPDDAIEFDPRKFDAAVAASPPVIEAYRAAWQAALAAGAIQRGGALVMQYRLPNGKLSSFLLYGLDSPELEGADDAELQQWIAQAHAWAANPDRVIQAQVVTAQQVIVGPDMPSESPFPPDVEADEPDPAMEPQPGEEPTIEPPAIQHLKLRNEQLYERAIAAGAREMQPGTAQMGDFGWIWHPAAFGKVRDPAKYRAVLDEIEKRVFQFEQRPRTAQTEPSWDEVHRHFEKHNPAKSTGFDAPGANWAVMRWEGPVPFAVNDPRLEEGGDVGIMHDSHERTVVEEYAARVRAGSSLPAIIVTENSRGELGVSDGAHRLEAARLLGLPTIDAYIGWRKRRHAQEQRDIVVSIPAKKLKEIEAEEADVARRQQQGEQGLRYFWEMGRLPATQPRRIYFFWDGAVRAYHDVLELSPNPSGRGGRIYMDTAIHAIDPIPMDRGFQGYRYFDEAAQRAPAPASRSQPGEPAPAQAPKDESAVVTAASVLAGDRDADVSAGAAAPQPRKQPGARAVIVIRIPGALARMWPKDQKGGPPHFTLAYVKGPHDEAARTEIIRIMTEVARATAPIPVELEKGVEWFTSDAGDGEVAHKTVHPKTAERMTALHWKLIEALEEAGFEPAVRDEYRPHATLAYCATRGEYKGPSPEGGFTADGLELWGWDDTPRASFGSKTRATPEDVLGLNVEAAKRRRKEKRRRFAGETFFLPKGGWYAHLTRDAAGDDAEEIRLKPDARVLREGAKEYLELEGKSLEDVFERAREAGYDAVQADQKLAVINEEAIADRIPAWGSWAKP